MALSSGPLPAHDKDARAELRSSVGFGMTEASGRGVSVADPMKTEAETAVKELRLFISLYEGVDLYPESRKARQLEAARRAVAAFEAVERQVAASAA